MSEADEMFDELGLWLERENPFEFEVKNDDDKVIKINKETKKLLVLIIMMVLNG